MNNESQERRWTREWALGASLAVHLIVIAFLIFGLPTSRAQPEKDQTIPVKLVPPPKPVDKPKPKPATQPVKPLPEKSQAAKAAAPPPHAEPSQNSKTSAAKPVFQFGKNDTGPRKTPDGDSALDVKSSTEAPSAPAQKDAAEPQALTAATAKGRPVPPVTREKPVPAPAHSDKAQSNPKLQEAKKLFSTAATGSPQATTAMHNMPRDVRTGWLCVTEMREQLAHGSPPYFPELLPADRLKKGTVMNIEKAAFRAGGEWYDLSYRCEIDSGATKVQSFAFHVGDAIPPSEWAMRGLPSQ